MQTVTMIPLMLMSSSGAREAGHRGGRPEPDLKLRWIQKTSKFFPEFDCMLGGILDLPGRAAPGRCPHHEELRPDGLHRRLAAPSPGLPDTAEPSWDLRLQDRVISR